MRILVVDDSTTMRRIIGNVLTQIGISSEDYDDAKDGVEALKLTNKNTYDLILTDWNMPNMDGLTFVKKLREPSSLYVNTPIVMITTEGGKSEVITALKAGVNNYIVKPFNAPTLKEKLSPFFEGNL